MLIIVAEIILTFFLMNTIAICKAKPNNYIVYIATVIKQMMFSLV
jgi:hypothetical protein